MAAEAHEAKFQPLPKAYVTLSGLKLPTFAHSRYRSGGHTKKTAIFMLSRAQCAAEGSDRAESFT